MKNFNTPLHTMIQSADGSYTAYSKEYDEHYHSTKDGALFESLKKHVEPAFMVKSGTKEIIVLDICFGLGFNTLATLYYRQKNAPDVKLRIFSPELDISLVAGLLDFSYPKEFEEFLPIIAALVKNGVYKDATTHIELFLGDARVYVKEFAPKTFDVVFQDAFSPASNPVLWTMEYFADIKNIIKDDGVLTTYSIALPTRLALYENGFELFVNSGEGFRDATIASPTPLEGFERVDMEHKIKCNPLVCSLRD